MSFSLTSLDFLSPATSTGATTTTLSTSTAANPVEPVNVQENTVSEGLVCDLIFSRMMSYGIVCEKGQLIRSIDLPYPSLGYRQLMGLWAFLNEDIELSQESRIKLLDLTNCIVSEVKQLHFTMRDIALQGWGVWHLLEQWFFIEDAIDEFDDRIFAGIKPEHYANHIKDDLEFVICITDLDTDEQALKLLRKGLAYNKELGQMLNFSFEMLGIFPNLVCPIKMTNGQRIILRVVALQEHKTLDHPNPLSILIRDIPNSLDNIPVELVCDLSTNVWQLNIDYLIGSPEPLPTICKDEPGFLLEVRKFVMGCVPMEGNFQKLQENWKRINFTRKSEHEISEMMERYFKWDNPLRADVVYAFAFQLCAINYENRTNNEAIWKAAKTYVSNHFSQDKPKQCTTIFPLIAKLVTEDHIPFCAILSLLGAVGSIHQHTQESKGLEKDLINFRFSDRNGLKVVRVSFISAIDEKFFVCFGFDFTHYLEIVRIAAEYLHEDKQEKLILLFEELLPLIPIDLESVRASTSAYEFADPGERPLPNHVEGFLKIVFSFRECSQNPVSFFDSTMNFFDMVLMFRSQKTRKFLFKTIQNQFQNRYGIDQDLEYLFTKHSKGKDLSRNLQYHFLLDLFSYGAKPLSLVDLKNHWRKNAKLTSMWSEEFKDVGLRLLVALIDKSLHLESLGLLEFLFSQEKIKIEQAQFLLSKICGKLQKAASFSNIDKPVCYNQIGHLIKFLLEKLPPSREARSLFLLNDFGSWLILTLLDNSQTSLTADILVLAHLKNVLINGKSICEVIREWNHVSERHCHLFGLKTQLWKHNNPAGKQIAQECQPPAPKLLTTVLVEQTNGKGVLNLTEIESILKQKHPLSSTSIKMLFSSLESQSLPDSEVKNKIVSALVKCGRSLDQLNATTQNLYQKFGQMLLQILQQKRMIEETADMFLSLSELGEWKWTVVFETWALSCVEQLLESRTQEKRLFLSMKLMKKLLGIPAFHSRIPNEKLMEISCKLANDCADNIEKLFWIQWFLKANGEKLWSDHAQLEVLRCLQNCVQSMQDIEIASKLMGVLIKAKVPISTLAQHWVSVFNVLTEEQQINHIVDYLFHAVSLFQQKMDRDLFHVKAEKLKIFFQRNKKIAAGVHTKAVNVMNALSVKDGEIWYELAQVSKEMGTKRDFIAAWVPLEVAGSLIYQSDVLKKNCWEMAMASFHLLPKNLLVLLIQNQKCLNPVFTDVKKPLVELVKRGLNLLKNQDKSDHVLITDLIAARNSCVVFADHFCAEVDSMLISVLLQSKEMSFLQKCLSFYDSIFNDRILSNDESGALFDFYNILEISTSKVRDSEPINRTLIGLSSKLREKLPDKLDVLRCAEALLHIPMTEARTECAKLLFKKLDQVSPTSSPTKATKSSSQAHKFSLVLDILIQQVPQGVDPKEVVSCLNHGKCFNYIALPKVFENLVKISLKMISSIMSGSASTADLFDNWIHEALKNVGKMGNNKELYNECFERTIDANLQFLSRFNDSAKFSQTHAEITRALSNGTVESFVSSLFKHGIKGFSKDSEHQKNNLAIFFKIISKYQKAIDHLALPEHITAIYAPMAEMMFKSSPFLLQTHVTDVVIDVLKCYMWNPPKICLEKHIKQSVEMCEKAVELNVFAGIPNLANKVIPEIFNQFFIFVSSYPENMELIKDCYSSIKTICSIVIDKPILDRSILETLIPPVIALYPLPYVLEETDQTESTEIDSDNYLWLYELLRDAREHSLVSVDLYNALSQYLSTKFTSANDLKTVCNILQAHPSYYSAIRLTEILRLCSKNLNQEGFQDICKRLVDIVKRLPANANTYPLTLDLWDFATTFMVQLDDAYSPHPLMRAMVEKQISFAFDNLLEENYTRCFSQLKFCLNKIGIFCRMQRYENEWKHLFGLLKLIRPYLEQINGQIDGKPCSAEILFLLKDDFSDLLDDPTEQSERANFFIACVTEIWPLASSEQKSDLRKLIVFVRDETHIFINQQHLNSILNDILSS